MSHVIQPGASMHGIALRHDFQQSPVGSLGGRQVQQGQAQAPRSLGRVLSDVGRGIQNLASRALNAVTPHSVRADTKFRAGLKDTSAQLGDLLGAISHSGNHSVDGAAAQRLLQSLPGTAQPATSRGLPYAQLIEQRTAVHLAHMSPAQRQALHTGLAMAENSALRGDPTLAAVRRAMEQGAVEAGIPALQGDLDQAIAMVARETQDKGITGRAFQELYNTARQVLEQQGFGGLPRDELKHLQRALVLQALEQRMSGAEDPADLQPLADMINHLPTRELHALMHEDRQLGAVQPSSTSFVLMGAIGLRSEQLEQSLTDGFAALLGHGEPAVDDPGGLLHSPQAFARQVAEMGQALADLRQHSEVHGQHFPPELDAAYARTLAHLEDYLTPLNLSQLSELSSSQLHAFGQGLRQLGVEAGQAEVAADAARRRTEAFDQYAQGLQPALQALSTGNLTGGLQSLANAQRLGDTALTVHSNLGRKIDGADDIMDFRAELTAHALQGLDTPTLQALAQRLGSPVADELSATLSDSAMLLLSDMNMTGYDPQVGRRMFDRATDLYMLREAVGNALQERGADVPAPGWPGAAPDLAALVEQQYGVEATSDGSIRMRAGLGGPAMQEALQANIDDMLEHPQTDPPHAEHPLVSDGFIKDLTRADFGLIAPDGTRQPLLAPGAGNQDAQIGNAVTQLRALAGNNDALLLLATRLANQNVQAGVQQALMSQQSPMRLDDGTPGRLMGDEDNRYTFSSDGQGGLILQVDYGLSNASAFLPAPRNAREGVGVPVMLDAAHSQAQLRFALHIGADLSVQMHDPLQYTYDAVRAP